MEEAAQTRFVAIQSNCFRLISHLCPKEYYLRIPNAQSLSRILSIARFQDFECRAHGRRSFLKTVRIAGDEMNPVPFEEQMGRGLGPFAEVSRKGARRNLYKAAAAQPFNHVVGIGLGGQSKAAT